jgi:cytochrome P450
VTTHTIATDPDATADSLVAALSTAQGRADPYPVYSRLRELAPVHRSASGAVFLTGYDDCVTVTRDPGFRAQGPEWMDRISPGWRERPGKVATIESMLFRDPPDHTRLRRLVSTAFTPRHIAGLQGEVARLVDAALDTLADAGRDGGPVNLHEILAATLPVSVIGTLVGVPKSDWTLLQESMSAMMQVVELTVDKAAGIAADRGAENLLDYFSALVAERRRAPRNDLATALVAVRDAAPVAAEPGAGAAGGLTETELLQTVILLFMAGVDTMVNHLVNGTAALLAHPDQLAALRADPGLASSAVEEMLRYDPPIQIMGRVSGADTVVGGLPVAAGTLLICLLGAANRDPAQFADPDRFDLSRAGTAALSFGGGIHYCLGAPLARMESAAFFPALLARFPKLRGAGTPVRRGLVLRGFADLPVALA